MGGNAFGTPAVPLIPWAYDRLLAHITQALSGLELAVPPPLPKEEHGDVDVLVSSSLADFEGDSTSGELHGYRATGKLRRCGQRMLRALQEDGRDDVDPVRAGR